MSRPLRTLPADPVQLDGLLAALGAALDGTGPAVRVSSAARRPDRSPADRTSSDRTSPDRDPVPLPTLVPDDVVPDDVALVVDTSGSTGAPRSVLLSAAALHASAAATDVRLGGPGQWLLALPLTHVAGLQVLVRSILAGTEPVLSASGRFRPDRFATDVARLTGPRRYVSLVPTQLHRLLDDAGPGLAALATLDTVLLGGAATGPSLLARARAAGVRITTTYGMSETCGGCVYDGAPLDGVRIRLDDDDRILLAGPMLATGYLDRPDLDAETFRTVDGVRWLRTSDVGELVDGRLTVHGRLDDMLVTGGAKVAPAAVERLVGELPGIGEVCVVGVPDAEWGQAVTAVVVLAGGWAAPTLDSVRMQVTRNLGAPAAPQHLVVVDRLPTRGPGKTDRRAVAVLAAARLT